MATEPTGPWYLRSAALKIIRRLRANRPERRFEQFRYSRNREGISEYAGFDAIALRALCAKEFKRVDDQRPWNRDAVCAVMDTSADEIMAGLFGDPNNLDWAHPERAERRAKLAAEIEAALDAKVAA